MGFRFGCFILIPLSLIQGSALAGDFPAPSSPCAGVTDLITTAGVQIKGRMLPALEPHSERMLSGYKRPSYEIRSGGELVTRPDQLRNLQDDVYVFAIDERGRPAIMSRTPNLRANVDTDPYLGNHLALVDKLKEDAGKPVAIIAAGEIRIVNGRVASITNRSGTFRANNTRAHLDFSVDVLRDHGLRVETAGPSTVIFDYARASEAAHIEAALAGRIHIQNIQRDLAQPDKAKRSYENLLELRKALAEKFPDPETPGYIDVDKALHAFLDPVTKELPKLQIDRDAILDAQYVIGLLQEAGNGPTLTMHKLEMDARQTASGLAMLRKLTPNLPQNIAMHVPRIPPPDISDLYKQILAVDGLSTIEDGIRFLDASAILGRLRSIVPNASNQELAQLRMNIPQVLDYLERGVVGQSDFNRRWIDRQGSVQPSIEFLRELLRQMKK